MVLLVLGIKEVRHYLWPRRFVEVVPGHIYRSGYLEPGPLERVIDEHGIRTILVLLNNEPDNPQQQQEMAIAGRKGVHVLRIGMPGDGKAEHALLEQAADVLANESRHPVLVHCAAGVNRTGAVCAVWRMKHCGWSVDAALEEAEACGWSPRDNPGLADHLRSFAASRPAGTGSAPAPPREHTANTPASLPAQ